MISFGTIPSRRLGKSLGINNIFEPKVCTFNCVYCQVGKTKYHSSKRQEFFQPKVIFNEIKQHLEKLDPNDFPDYLTFVSCGEPTLDINLGKVIKLIKKLGIPIAVITNASLLIDESVRNELQLANYISVKMDAADNETWQAINQPYHKLSFEEHINAINVFANEYKGILCTETMIINKMNDKTEHITALAEMIKNIHPAKAYIAIPVRPPSVKTAKAASIEKVNEAWQIFSAKGINAELLIGFEGTETGYTGNIFEDVFNITAVHPLREDSLQELLRKDNADFSVIESMINQNLIKVISYYNHKYYYRQYQI